MVANLCRPGHGDLAVGMKGAVARGRADENRAIVGETQDRAPRVDLADIDKAPRPQLELEKALAIGAQGHLIVDARDEVPEVRRRQVLARDGLEIEEIA